MTSVPRWAAWLDALVLILTAVTVKAAVSHGFHLILIRQALAVHAGDPWRPAVAVLILVAVRHWLVPRPNLLQRIAAIPRAWRSEPRAGLARLWAASRFGVLFAGMIAILVIGRPAGMTYRVSDDPLVDLTARWDAAWYSGIAREGYSYNARTGGGEQQTVAFFPAYPMILRVAAAFTEPERVRDMSYDTYIERRDSRIMWAGSLVTIALFLPALMVFYRWAESKGGPDVGGGAVLLLAAYPFSVFYSAPYTESLFLLAAVGACLAFEQHRWLSAAVFGLLTGLTRPNGAMLSLTLGLLAIAPVFRRERITMRSLALRVAVASMPGVGMLLYSAYIYSLTGDPLAWMKVQQAWGRSFAGTMGYVQWTMTAVRDQGFLFYVKSAPVEMIQTLAALFALVMVWPVWRRLGAAYAVFILANLLPPLFKGGVLSIGRMTSTLFPVFAVLAMMVPPERRGGWLVFFAIGQGLIAALFFTWRPVY